MSFNVKISIDERAYTKDMKLAEKQIAYATALALGMTAGNGKVSAAVGSGGARDELKGSLRRYMTIRGNKQTGGWMGRSMRSTRAGKSKTWADVGTVDENLADQALGGVRRNRNPRSQGIAIPVVGEGLGRPNKETKVGGARWMGDQIEKDMKKQSGAQRLFVIKSGNKKLIMKKVGKLKKRERKRGTSKRVRSTSIRGRGGDARVMWSIAPDVRIKVIWPFARIVQLAVIRHWQRNADAAFTYAFKTQK